MFKRLGNLIRGFFGLSVSGLERRHPEALLEVEKENLRAQIARFNEGLAAHAGLCERLIAQVKKLETEERELRAKTTALLRAGNQELAAPNALRLQTITRELSENRTQAADAEDTYRELIRTRDASIKAARQKIEDLKFDLKDLKVQRAQAELTELATGMISEIGGAGDTLDRLQSLVAEERESAAGRMRVARDSAPAGEFATQAAEQSALAEQALADFAAAEGIALNSDAPVGGGDATVPTAKSMGPGSQEQ